MLLQNQIWGCAISSTVQYICWADELIYFWLRCGLTQTLGGWGGGGGDSFSICITEVLQSFWVICFPVTLASAHLPGSWDSADVLISP